MTQISPNEGNVDGTKKSVIKTAMMQQIERLKEADARTWEHATFQAITGESVDNIDWDIKENVSGYRLWMGTFEQISKELEADGYVEFTHRDEAGIPFVRPRKVGLEHSWGA